MITVQPLSSTDRKGDQISLPRRRIRAVKKKTRTSHCRFAGTVHTADWPSVPKFVRRPSWSPSKKRTAGSTFRRTQPERAALLPIETAAWRSPRPAWRQSDSRPARTWAGSGHGWKLGRGAHAVAEKRGGTADESAEAAGSSGVTRVSPHSEEKIRCFLLSIPFSHFWLRSSVVGVF